MLLHVPPFVDFSVSMHLPLWDKEIDTHGGLSRMQYEMHINIVAVVAVVQVFIYFIG
tara:strand:+ start:1555 stop:1725 length:171 start_codon:yes stop_codon:yes gene_type:complete